MFNSNVMLKDRITECAAYQRQLADVEKKLYEENKENAQVGLQNLIFRGIVVVTLLVSVGADVERGPSKKGTQ